MARDPGDRRERLRRASDNHTQALLRLAVVLVLLNIVDLLAGLQGHEIV